jgi:hypothetical protein
MVSRLLGAGVVLFAFGVANLLWLWQTAARQTRRAPARLARHPRQCWPRQQNPQSLPVGQIDRWLAAARRRRMFFFTYATAPGDMFCATVESALRQRVPLHILGWGLTLADNAAGRLYLARLRGQVVNASGGVWQRDKFPAVRYALGRCAGTADMPPDSVVGFADGYDTIFAAGFADTARRARDLLTDGAVVFSSECGAYPSCDIAGMPRSATPLHWVNSGNWLGTVASATTMLDLALLDPGKNDQLLATELVARRRDIARADSTAAFSLAMQHCSADRVHASGAYSCALRFDPFEQLAVRSDGTPLVKFSGASPLLLHFNGNDPKARVYESPAAWPFRKLRFESSRVDDFPVFVEGTGFLSYDALGCKPGAVASFFDGSVNMAPK